MICFPSFSSEFLLSAPHCDNNQLRSRLTPPLRHHGEGLGGEVNPLILWEQNQVFDDRAERQDRDKRQRADDHDHTDQHGDEQRRMRG